jgi:hypothetical protein
MTWNDRDLAREVLEEFCEAGAGYSERVHALEAAYRSIALGTEERRAKKVRAAAAEVRKAEGLEDKICPVCEAFFQVDRTTPGKPQEYCSHGCAVAAAMRAYRARLRAAVGKALAAFRPV